MNELKRMALAQPLSFNDFLALAERERLARPCKGRAAIDRFNEENGLAPILWNDAPCTVAGCCAPTPPPPLWRRGLYALGVALGALFWMALRSPVHFVVVTMLVAFMLGPIVAAAYFDILADIVNAIMPPPPSISEGFQTP